MNWLASFIYHIEYGHDGCVPDILHVQNIPRVLGLEFNILGLGLGNILLELGLG